VESYFQAAIPEPFRILGLALRPLSLGHYRLLKRFDCAFVADGEAKAGPGDLILGLLICSMPPGEFLSWLSSPHFYKEVRAWGRGLTPFAWLSALPWIGKWYRRRWGFNVFEKVALFRRYLEEHSAVPAHWVERDGGNSGAHWSQAMEVALRGELNWSAEEINEQPLSKAIADYFKWAENQGAIRLMSKEEIQQGEENARLMEAIGATETEFNRRDAIDAEKVPEINPS